MEVPRMPHKIVYDYIGPEEGFRTLRLVWEPLSDRVAIYFRTEHEAMNGMIKPLRDMIDYLDRRGLTGPPWSGRVAREARGRLAAIMGTEAPQDPLGGEGERARLRRIG